MNRKPVTAESLIARLDRDGIDKAVVLPWPICPEAVEFPGLFAAESGLISQIKSCARHVDRLIPFGNADPRWGGNSSAADFSWLLERFVEMGCVGMGEVSANVFFDDPRVINLLQQCGEWHLPVTIESTGPGEGQYGFVDEIGSPHLENLLQQVPDTIILGHGPGFWAEIDADITPKDKRGYPRGPVRKEGRLPRLLRTYSNLSADISALSGYNALTRDEAFGIRFVNEFQDKLVFGTDVCFDDEEGFMPQLRYLRKLLSEEHISQNVFHKITCKNALGIMKRYKV